MRPDLQEPPPSLWAVVGAVRLVCEALARIPRHQMVIGMHVGPGFCCATLLTVPPTCDSLLGWCGAQGDDGALFDLSSAFQPNVSEYGTAVPPSFANARLCLRPMQRAHSLACCA